MILGARSFPGSHPLGISRRCRPDQAGGQNEFRQVSAGARLPGKPRRGCGAISSVWIARRFSEATPAEIAAGSGVTQERGYGAV